MIARPLFLLTLLGLLLASPVHAHFGMIIPSQSMPDDSVKEVDLVFSFSHPFEAAGMDMDQPRQAAVFHGGKTLPLDLEKTTVMEHTGYKATHRLQRPGASTVYMEPQPYWEPAEDCFIIHYTKTVIPVWNDDEGWDTPVGLQTEIIPLSKPFGLYAGNVFQGQVLLDGKPVPFSEVEIEFYNANNDFKAPSELMITQTVKADQNGVFTYAAPWSGWWGFAALNTAPYTLPHNGEQKDVELGAVLWVDFQKPRR